jgi:hypothetical protein
MGIGIGMMRRDFIKGDFRKNYGVYYGKFMKFFMENLYGFLWKTYGGFMENLWGVYIENL